MRVCLTTPEIERPASMLRGDELAAFERGDEVMIFDQECRGLVLRLQRRSDGDVKKVFQVRYQFEGRGRQYHTLGHFKSEIDLQSAREKARAIRDNAKRGIHPIVTAAAEANKHNEWLACPTFISFAADFIKEKTELEGDEKWRDKTLAAANLYLTGDGYSKPLRQLRLHQITRRAIGSQVKLIAKDSPSSAKQWLTYIRMVFNSALGAGYINDDPTHKISAPAAKARERFLNPTELGALWRATENDEEYSKIIRLILLTGGRRREEVGGMLWSEIEGNVWTIPAERHKTGRKSKQAIVLPLLPEALKLINSMPRQGEFVFSRRFNIPKNASGWKYDKSKLDERLELPEWTLHTLRHTVVTLMGDELEIDKEQIKMVTNHTGKNGKDAFDGYDHAKYLKPKTGTLNRWAEYLHQCAGDNVTALRAAA